MREWQLDAKLRSGLVAGDTKPPPLPLKSLDTKRMLPNAVTYAARNELAAAVTVVKSK